MKAIFILYFLMLVVNINCTGINLKVNDNNDVDSQIFPGDLKLEEVLPIIMSELNELRQEVAHLKAKMSISEKEDELKMKRRELLLKANDANKSNYNQSNFSNNTSSRQTNMHSSCLELELSQTSFPNGGFYIVSDSIEKKVKLVYCNFTISPDNTADYQTDIGYVDVKSVPTYFYVQRSSTIDTVDVSFNVVRINVADAMDAGTGVFTAPVDGIYFFSFSGVKKSTLDDMRVILQLGDTDIGSAFCPDDGRSNACSLHSTLALKKGDRIKLKKYGNDLVDSNYKNTHFTGYLLEQTDLPLI